MAVLVDLVAAGLLLELLERHLPFLAVPAAVPVLHLEQEHKDQQEQQVLVGHKEILLQELLV
jgi:hypothetical protein